jgi:hypothetical protein
MKVNIFCLIVLFALTACGTKLPLTSEYFKTKTKVGVVVSAKIDHNGSHSGGGVIGVVTSMALNTGDKYSQSLTAIEPELDPREKFNQLYLETLTSKGKDVVTINDAFKGVTFEDFTAPKDDKKYYKKDLRYIKDKYGIDELLIVSIRYGVYSYYKYGIETRKYGWTSLHSITVNLNDNSIIYKSGMSSNIKIDGKWDIPPAYENLKKMIGQSIDRVINGEREKYILVK